MRRRHALSKGGMRRVLVGAVLLVAVGAAGCTSARNALGPSESPCFRAIPLARAAVNDKGKFSGVRYVTAQRLQRGNQTSEGGRAREGQSSRRACRGEGADLRRRVPGYL